MFVFILVEKESQMYNAGHLTDSVSQRKEAGMWDIRGWNRLTVHSNPPLVAARREFLSWVAEVAEPVRTIWGGRLQSKLDHPHLSVRLELFLHHYFKHNDWSIEIEPEIPGSPNKPDFRVMRSTDMLLVEAKAILDEQSITQETTRLTQVADDLSGKLSRYVIIEPLSDLPPTLPARRIKAQIEQHAQTQASAILEFDLSDVHEGKRYSLRVVLLPERPDTTELGGLGGMMSGAHTLTTGKRIRDALEEKAGKYGSMDVPFVIAIYGAGHFPVLPSDELDALCGDKIWNEQSHGQFVERRQPNGFFNSVREGKHRHEGVSAVASYRFQLLAHTHVHLLHIYHNPFAVRPLNPDLFPTVPQMATDSARSLKWINGEPESW